MTVPVLDLLSQNRRTSLGTYRIHRAKIERRIAKEPQVNYFLELARLEASKSHWERAQKAIESALELDPYSGEAQLFLAQLLELQGKHEEARSVYLNLLDQHAYMSVAYREFGRFLMEQGSISLAQSLLLRGLELNPKDAMAHILLAEIYVRKDRRAQALLHLNIAKRYADGQPAFYQRSAQLLMALEEYDEAARHFKLAMQGNRKNKSLRVLFKQAMKAKENNKKQSILNRWMIWKRWGW
ncbi:tetratricopeptide repeat protein [Thermoflavimicrobium dichotomicum]|uniref:Tetratricopeptide repeat-containing protein n=1 Tax=Thermoflavimicrobium dichotomicum TaxID=46223 RepID=A0A1I3MIJ6_9BACL|nr:tetratricopeptide repeat protein [Thermoflavimicrobium dichotomicum]SFI96819.1 Tetratricopeptide repeat-containing protein [Thermoflavimicrobium dichotomicum]